MIKDLFFESPSIILNWYSSSNKLEVSNWEWMSISFSESFFNISKVTGTSLIKARDFPVGRISRRITVLISKSKSFSSKKILKFSVIINSASTTLLVSALWMDFTSALSPKIKRKAPRIIDFPAPVSPVITCKPLFKVISSESMSAKFWMNILESIFWKISYEIL